MVVIFVLSDSERQVNVAFYRNHEFVNALEYFDYGNTQNCIVRDGSPVSSIVQKNKYKAAFDNLSYVASRFYSPETGEKIIFDFNFERYNGPILFPRLLANIDQLIFRGNITANLIDQWFYGMSSNVVPNITIHVKKGEVMKGLGQLDVVQEAQKLEIIGDGFSDVSDIELMDFHCDKLHLRSTKATKQGVKSFIEKRNKKNAENQECVICKLNDWEDRYADVIKNLYREAFDVTQSFQQLGI